MITYKKADSPHELQQILALQKHNLPESISDKEKITEGFLTVKHDFTILNDMNEVCAHIIAKDGGQVIGYALCMHPRFRKEIEVLRSMFEKIDRILDQEEDYIVMGQICIDKKYRKKGVFRKLYENMANSIPSNISKIITEVDSTNKRSLNAHLGVGFQSLSTYSSDGRVWELISLKV